MLTVFIANTAYPELLNSLRERFNVITIPETDQLYEGIQNHTDLHIHNLFGHLLISQEASQHIEHELIEHHIRFTVIKETLGTKYPDTVLLNALSTDKYLIHNTKATSKQLIREASVLGLKPIHVNQGYVRCLTLPLSEELLLTSDKGVYRSLLEFEDLEVHLIENGPVDLPGQSAGFFAGACGVIEDTLYINGDLSLHPDATHIRDLCQKTNLAIKDIPGQPLRDIGSILSNTPRPLISDED